MSPSSRRLAEDLGTTWGLAHVWAPVLVASFTPYVWALMGWFAGVPMTLAALVGGPAVWLLRTRETRLARAAAEAARATAQDRAQDRAGAAREMA